MGFKETEISLLFNPCSIYSFTELQNLAQEQLQTQETGVFAFFTYNLLLTGQGIY